jgi:hypothetical protein
MPHSKQAVLEALKFELRFLEDGGYGRSPRTPWRPQFIFEDSPTCLNFDDPARPHPCHECMLMQFVPEEFQEFNSPCRFIPLNERGQSVDYFYRCGTQPELEESLAGWLRAEIRRLEGEPVVEQPAAAEEIELSKLAET